MTWTTRWRCAEPGARVGEEVMMGIYSDHVLPHAMNVVCGMGDSAVLRARVCAGLSGEVVEVGFGSGHNVPFYPAPVTRVAAVEPSDVAWRLAGHRLKASPTAVERSGLDGQALPFEDHTFDAALSTWTMCTIPNVAAALAEVRRVLKPGGRLHFIEHGLAPDPGVRTWQRRLEPVQKRMAGGCHLTRPIVDLLIDAGFQVTEVDVFYEKGAPKFIAADSLGLAAAP